MTDRALPRLLGRCLAAAAIGVVVAAGSGVLAPAAAAAHPLGLPAFARVAATGVDEVTVIWNAAADDVAALARSLGHDVPEDGTLSADQDAALAQSPALAEALADGIVVRQDGRACPAQTEVTSLLTRGATLRFHCPRPVHTVTLELSLLTGIDDRYRTLGIVGTTDGPERWMFTATDPAREFSLDPDAAAEVLSAGPDEAPEDAAGGLTFGGSLPLERRFVALIDAAPAASAVALGLLVAFGVGSLHGLAPGHGKAIAAAYLVGDRGRPRDAVLLGATVALMHTGSVLAIGLALYRATRRPGTAELSAGLQLVSGLVVAGLGAWLLWRRWRGRTHDHHHDHQRDDEHHGHTHGLGPGVHPLSWRGLVALGAAGGLLPSPSALLVLFTALAVGRVAYGLSLIGAFSLGLALTVTAVGLAALWGRDLAVTGLDGRWASRVVRWAPVVAAAGVLVLGSVVVVRGAAALV